MGSYQPAPEVWAESNILQVWSPGLSQLCCLILNKTPNPPLASAPHCAEHCRRHSNSEAIVALDHNGVRGPGLWPNRAIILIPVSRDWRCGGT